MQVTGPPPGLAPDWHAGAWSRDWLVQRAGDRKDDLRGLMQSQRPHLQRHRERSRVAACPSLAPWFLRRDAQRRGAERPPVEPQRIPPPPGRQPPLRDLCGQKRTPARVLLAGADGGGAPRTGSPASSDAAQRLPCPPRVSRRHRPLALTQGGCPASCPPSRHQHPSWRRGASLLSHRKSRLIRPLPTLQPVSSFPGP